jgi:hypothetical protein
VLLACLVVLSISQQLSTRIVVLQALAAVGVLLFLWTRPDPR